MVSVSRGGALWNHGAARLRAAAGGAALAKALAPDAAVLVPGENVLRGAAAFAKMLPAMSRAISGSVAWTPVHAVVARDGALGCTTGVLHLPAADSAQSSTGRYASCWRRGADGAWRMVAHSRVMAEADRAFARFSADSG